MSGRLTAILGIAGAASVGIYIKMRKARRAQSGPKRSVHTRSQGRIEIDDDMAAEIIKRARPELLRARLLYGY